MNGIMEQLGQLTKEFLFSKPKTWRHFGLQLVFFVSGITFVVALSLLVWTVTFRLRMRKTKGRKRYYPSLEPKAYDVIVVGVGIVLIYRRIFKPVFIAGPAGSTCAYYLAKSGKRVLLLEKKKFPRDKFCGDAVCTQALDIMDDMIAAPSEGAPAEGESVLDCIMREGKGHPASNGGLVSPAGFSYIGSSAENLVPENADKNIKRLDRAPVIAIKRIHMDEKIAKAAKYAGACLLEERSVENAVFDNVKKVWVVHTVKEDGTKTEETHTGRIVVCADGAPSRLAMKLGLVTTPPQGTCSRAFVEGKTHNFAADGLVFYPKHLLPGYCAVFRHPNDELNFCTYIIPGNPNVTNDDLSRLHHEIMEKDPFVSRALGSNAVVERMKAGSLRLGGISKSYAEQLLIIGDAAGQIDPLTGEGIHHAMVRCSKKAAEVLIEAFSYPDFSEGFLKNYHKAWYSSFGWDFIMSMKLAIVLYKFPVILDAATKALETKGDEFLAEWAKVMTGQRPKTYFFRPDVSLVMFWELLKLVVTAPFRR
eukprot:jgi/Galph1/2525/GphlegSOOS_G1201.1